MRENLSSREGGLTKGLPLPALPLEEDKALRFWEPLGVELGLSHAFLRSCSDRTYQ